MLQNKASDKDNLGNLGRFMDNYNKLKGKSMRHIDLGLGPPRDCSFRTINPAFLAPISKITEALPNEEDK